MGAATECSSSAFWVLLRWRAVQLRNALDQQLRDAPLRALIVVILLLLIWAGLDWILTQVLRQVGRYELVALVAKQQIFVQFFLVLAIMLAFSNAILAFGSLFGRGEAAHLLSMPALPRHVVCVKWLEGMVLSSWSFLLLGVPLMLAVAGSTDVEWYYYPLFVGHFLGFVLIPATLGLLVAWAVALWAPRRPVAVAIWCAIGLVLVGGGWLASMVRAGEITDEWLRTFYRRISLAQQPWLPSTWSARGVFAAIERRVDVSVLYLGAVLANGAFLSWLVINLLGWTWGRAYSRAHQGRTRAPARSGWLTAAACALLFPYLPQRLRTLILKDVRSFARDPTQWTQMVIMMGLLVIYAANLKRLPVDIAYPGMRAVVAFLNITTVSLILATFTSRFIFPLLSLESQQLWLLTLLPVRRRQVLLSKFVFALTVTGLSTLLVMGLAVRALDLSPAWVRLQLGAGLAVCIGLSGLAVGLGARFPVLGQRNPARIASGFGGTVNLIASMLFVGLELAGLGLAGLIRFRGSLLGIDEAQVPAWLLPAMLILALVTAATALQLGARHFERLEY